MIPWFDASTFTVLRTPVPTQGLLAIVGIAIGHYVFSRWLQRHLRLTPLRADQFGFATVTAAVLVGHLVAVVLTGSYAAILQVAAPQSSLGALFGGGLIGLWLIWHWELDVPVVLDAAAWAFLHGWPFVRLGCVLVHDHPGRVSSLPFAVAFPSGSRLDIGLLEWVGCLGMLAFGRLLMRSAPIQGRLAAWATLQFSALRLILEFLRVDSVQDLTQPANLTSILTCLAGLIIGAFLWRISRPVAADPE